MSEERLFQLLTRERQSYTRVRVTHAFLQQLLLLYQWKMFLSGEPLRMVFFAKD